MKKIALYTASIIGAAGLLALGTLALAPAAAVGAVTAWALTTGFFSFALGFGVVCFENNNEKSGDAALGLAGVVSTAAGLAAMGAINLAQDAPAPAKPAARAAFAAGTARPCPDPRRGEPVPVTAHCRAEMWQNLRAR
jgi:hypothetical protein